MEIAVKFYLLEARTRKGISQPKLSQISGVARSHIQKIEINATNPTVSTLCKLAKALDVPIWELFTYK